MSEVDPLDIAGAHLLQCGQKSGFMSSRWRGNQQRGVASEEYALRLVVEANRVAAVTRRMDHLEIRVAHLEGVPVAQQMVDALGIRRKRIDSGVKRRTNQRQQRVVVGM